jgi:hypothetical protein
LLNPNGKLRRLLISETGKVFIIGLSSRLLIFCAAILGSMFLGSTQVQSGTPIVNLFSQWDAAWYTKIALFGYPAGNNPLSGNWAFFPLYPFLMRVFGTPLFGVLPSEQAVLISGFLISNILFFVSLFLFYQITKIVFSNGKFSLVSTIFFAFWPGALFYSSVYSESLFMTFVLGAFYFLEKGQSGKSTILGFFAALARSNGFLVLIPFVYNGLQTRKYRTAFYQAIFIASPYFLFSVYGYFSTGLFPVREIVFNHLWGDSRLALTDVINVHTGYTVLFSTEALLILVPFAWFLLTEKTPINDFIKGSNAKRKDLKYWAFSIYILLILAFYSDPKSLHRYALPILPLYWVFASIWGKNKKIGKVLLIVSMVILVIGTIFFTTGRFYI